MRWYSLAGMLSLYIMRPRRSSAQLFLLASGITHKEKFQTNRWGFGDEIRMSTHTWPPQCRKVPMVRLSYCRWTAETGPFPQRIGFSSVEHFRFDESP